MDDTMWSALEQERLGLASLLEELTPEQWETPSLCALWRVRDVAAHVAMTPTAPTTSTLLRQLARARGNLWSAGAQIAIDHARRPTGEIVEQLRRDAAARTMPRITNPDNLLMDAIVHGQDIAVPLGIGRRRARPGRPGRLRPGVGHGLALPRQTPPRRVAARRHRRRHRRRRGSGRRGRPPRPPAPAHRPHVGGTSAPPGSRPGAGVLVTRDDVAERPGRTVRARPMATTASAATAPTTADQPGPDHT